MFKSGLEAVLGQKNPLNFQSKKRVCVVLVDGMGAEQVLARSGHAKYLSSAIARGETAFSAFPATTSTNIGSFATGVTAGEHGLIGHQVLDRKRNIRLNLLTGWTTETNPVVWQPNQNISELSFSLGIQTNVIAASEYQHTGYTKATMRQANFVAAESISDRFEKAREILSSPQESLSYLYIPELDKYGHRNGWQSPGWAALLEEVDSEVQRISKRLPKDSGLVVIADHGMVDTSEEMHLVLDKYFDSALEWFGGDTRASYVYLNDPKAIDSTLERFTPLSNSITAIRTTDLVEKRFFGDVTELALNRLPEIVLLAKGSHTLFHSEYSKKKSFEMIAHHGAPSAAEIRIPLVRIGI